MDFGLIMKQITYLEEYYLTNAEIDVLQTSSDSIAKAIPTGSMVVELGSGSVTISGAFLHNTSN
jgi:L-histidine Nalpha-methyltransferase / hercynylcysteine S-oxide synthase